MNKIIYREKTYGLVVDPKLILAWVAGALFMLGGVWIVNNAQLTLGVPFENYILALLTALLLFLGAGLLWIAVAVSTRHEF